MAILTIRNKTFTVDLIIVKRNNTIKVRLSLASISFGLNEVVRMPRVSIY